MGSLGQTVNMKTTFIVLACLLGITTAGYINPYTDFWNKKEKLCNNKAEEISSQDCKQQCDVAKFGDDCVECIGEHKDYDYDCKDFALDARCIDTYHRIHHEDCKEECGDWYENDNEKDKCETCSRPLQDQYGGLVCRISMHFESNPPSPPPGLV